MIRIAFVFACFVGIWGRADAVPIITPATSTLHNGQSLSLAVSGADASGVVWSASSVTGSLVSKGTTAVYTVPSTLNKSETVTVQVTSVSLPKIVAKAVIILTPIVSITVTPASGALETGDKVALHPTVLGSTNTAVSYSVSPAELGKVDATGVFTATTVLNHDATAVVTVSAQAQATRTATASIRVRPRGVSFTTFANGLQHLIFGGIDYNLMYGEGLLSYVWMQAPDGTIAQYTPTCTADFTATTVTKQCFAGADSVNLVVTYSTPSAGTVKADMVLTNNSPTNSISLATMSTLGLQMPLFDRASSDIQTISATTRPVSMGNFGTGRFLVWTNTPGPNVKVNQACGVNTCKNQPQLSNIAPGQSMNASFSLRLTTDMTSSVVDLAPEAYQAYRAAYPPVLNWPDRRPIVAWFISDHGHNSATNPRGYLSDPTIDASNVAAFQANVLAQARNILTSIKSRPVQPQGITIWDLEGQEFVQPTTYIGDPRVFSQGYAPEMDATADQLFAMFKSAGLKVGVTLRPNYMQWGPLANLPATCHSDPQQKGYDDYYVAVDAGFQKKFYACYAPDKWTLAAEGNGYQTNFTPGQVQQVTDSLMAKVAYARARWGTTIYYVDSTVWNGGTAMQADIFRALEQAYPDSLFIPEESSIATMSAAMPYSAPNLSSAPKYSPASWRYVYPNGADGVYLSNCGGTCWTNNVQAFDTGQKIGDIAIYGVPSQMSLPLLGSIEGMILNARKEAGTMTVTDASNGAVHSYSGTPDTVAAYPVKMRVYFAPSASALAASSTFCETGGWTGSNRCTLDLLGLTSAQVRYYDFAGNFVLSEPPISR